ncbi:MAG: DUF2062 domain-containing protein, partial [Campylobacterota bacterium]|nr:DUF2062 domain-containing protein [Campylobacterota bacterium]
FKIYFEMFKKVIKQTNNNHKIKDFLRKYNISEEYMSSSRRMVSRGIFLGLFIAFIPMPLQMFAVLLFTFVGRFNLPIALALCWITNPITMPFIYYVEYITGSFILNMDLVEVELTVLWFNSNIKNIVIPLYTGSIFYSTLFSTMAYYTINYRWKSIVYKKRRKNKL